MNVKKGLLAFVFIVLIVLAVWAISSQIGIKRVNAALTNTQSDYSALKSEIEKITLEANSAKIAAANEKITLEAQIADLNNRLKIAQAEIAASKDETTALKDKVVEMTTPADWVWDGTFQGLEPFYKNIDREVKGFNDPAATEMSYTCTTDFGVYGSTDPSTILDVATLFENEPVGAVFYTPCKVGQVIALSTTFWSEKSKNIPGHWSVHLNELTAPLPSEISVKDALLAHMDGEKKAIALLFNVDGTYEILTASQ